jgi:hypothetical protein
MVSGYPKQTVVRRGSLVFCASKSSEAERERMKPLERNERFCVDNPGPCSSQWTIQDTTILHEYVGDVYLLQAVQPL